MTAGGVAVDSMSVGGAQMIGGDVMRGAVLRSETDVEVLSRAASVGIVGEAITMSSVNHTS